jgi:hypothetical protein
MGPSFYARLKGAREADATALVHHMDVVPADPAHWSVEPFRGPVVSGDNQGAGSGEPGAGKRSGEVGGGSWLKTRDP